MTVARRSEVSFALKAYAGGVQLIWHVADGPTEGAAFASRSDALDCLHKVGLPEEVLADLREEKTVSHFRIHLMEDVVNRLGLMAMGIRLI
jgi:hypothetical protein